MSYIRNELYSSNPVNKNRIKTDSFFTDDKAENRFEGLLHNAILFAENEQLLDKDLWIRFVDQFRLRDDSADRGWRGEFWGKMMRGAAFVYAYTKNEELYSVISNSVEDILSTEDELGRISSYCVESDEGFGEFDGWDIWSRKYVLLGLQYFLEICQSEELKSRIVLSMCHQADYILSKLGYEEGKKRIVFATRNWRGLNSSSLLEPMVRLYMLTGEKRYLDFSEYIISEGGTSIFNIFEAAYENITDPYQYPITKAYEMMSCFEGILEYYRVTGEDKYKSMVLNFARKIIETDITVIGCSGTHSERFDHSRAMQTDSTYKGVMQETCVTVTWMKFCYQLLSLTGDPIFADCFEQSLYNAYLGSLNTEKSKCSNAEEFLRNPQIKDIDILPYDSYATLLGGTRGNEIGGFRIMRNNKYYGCCTCIAAAGAGLIPKVASMLSESGVVINLYSEGRISTHTPSGNSLQITTKTEYPVSGNISILVDPEAEEKFEIKLRIPEWSENTLLKVNGEEITAEKGYASISRAWKKGDLIELSLDMRAQILRPISNPRDLIIADVIWGQDYIIPKIVIASSDAEYRLAIRKGPLVLARDARCGEDIYEKIDITVDESDHFDLEASNSVNFAKVVEYKAKIEGGKMITLIDFSSAGKTWDKRSEYICWLPTTKKYTK